MTETLITGDNLSLKTIPFKAEISMDYLNNLEYVSKPKIVIRGREFSQNRDVIFFSNTSKGYNYSGQTTPVKLLTPELAYLLIKVNDVLGTDFNGMLINRYNSGSDFIGAHSDKTTYLESKTIATLSFGASRKFRLRDKKTKKIILDYHTKENELLVMDGESQKF